MNIEKTLKHVNEVAIFSDLHLGIYADSQEWHKVAIEWAKWVRETLLQEHKISTIFFLGDFFHNRTDVSVSTIHTGSKILEILEDFEIFVIVGNHDAWYKNRSDVHSLGMMRNWDNIHLIDKPTMFQIGPKKLCNFVPWGHEVEHESDYLFGHFETVSFTMNGVTTCEHGITPQQLLKKAPSVYSGHFHVKSEKTFKQGTICYVGNTFPMDFNDEGDSKGIYILDLKTGEDTFIENPVSPKFHRINITKADHKFKKSMVEGNVIKLIFDPELNEKDVETLTKKASSMKPFIIDYDYSSVVINVDSAEVDVQYDLVDAMSELVDSMDMDDALRTAAKERLEKYYEASKL